jgi:hypothetical protein
MKPGRATQVGIGEDMSPDISITDPAECVLWNTEAPTIEQLRNAFDQVTTYEDDSHFIRRLLRCKECGHLYFYEFYEEIDWQGGDDGQYWTWIPVDDEESGERLKGLSIIQILMYPSIRYDFPKGSNTPRGPAWYRLKTT